MPIRPSREPYLSADLIAANTGFEGDSPWLYLDDAGNVTAARGHLLPTPESANALPFAGQQVPPASEWAIVKAAKPGMGPNYYAHLTEGRLSFEDRADIQRVDLGTAARELQAAIPAAVAWPQCVQDCCIDMTFEMGPGVPGEKHGFLSYHNMLAAIAAGDWETAAKESFCEAAQPSRNEWRAAQIRKALLMNNANELTGLLKGPNV